MGLHDSLSPFVYVLELSCFFLSVSLAQERTFFSGKLNDSETIVSSFRTFRFGFFSPVNSTSRYAGIWYNSISVQTVIWVANKDKPINDSSGVISVSQDGNLVVTDGQRRVLWSTNVSTQARANSTVAELLDSGNLVLKEASSDAYLWESFKYPTDSWLPNMLVGTNARTGGGNVTITSWKNPSDPSPGSYTAALILAAYPELFIMNNNNNNSTVWRSGPWNGQMFNGLPDVYAGVFLYRFIVNDDTNGSVTMSYANDSTLRYFYMDYRGSVIRRDWSEARRNWTVGLQVPATECDIYRRCGEFATCNPRKNPPCSCIRGFRPRNLIEWNNGNWSGGCTRRVPLQCERQNNNGSADGFLRLRRMKLPDFARRSEASEPECLRTCLQTCSCIAAAHGLGYGCMIWNGSLVDSQELSASGLDLYIRLAHSEIKTKDRRPILIGTILAGGIFVVAACVLLARRIVMKKRAKKKGRDAEQIFERVEALAGGNKGKLKELPLFEFQVLAEATNNFSLRNKLGQGGFGPVYKVWSIWNEGEINGLVDPEIFDQLFEKEIHKCIHIGLLCVQEAANDRPSVATVCSMLSSEIVDIPEPKQPAFISRNSAPEADSSENGDLKDSINNVTITDVTGQAGTEVMRLHENVSPFVLVLPLSCFFLSFSLAHERAVFSGKLNDSETIVSSFRTFRFGFFSPINSTSRYAGIWYNSIPVQTVIWVANKDKPINDSSGVISLSEYGNLVVSDGQRRVLWSTTVSTRVRSNSTIAELLDSGNLVLKEASSDAYLWESFKYPTDSWLPNMLVGTNARTGGGNVTITSWKNPSDPSPGNYTGALVLAPYPELFIFNNNDNNATVWRSGPWNGQMFNGLPDVYPGVFLYRFIVNDDTNGSVTMSYANDSTLRHLYLDYRGFVIRRDWSEARRNWTVGSQVPATECDIYSRCGQYATCNPRKTLPCSCIIGFRPRNLIEWNSGNWSDGCIRKVPLQCERENNNGSADGFLKLPRMKLPDFARRSEASEPECLMTCLQSCSCIAFAHGLGYGCMIWNGSLVDSQELSASGMDLSIRLAHSEFSGIFVVAACVFLARRIVMKKRAKKKGADAEQIFKRVEALAGGNREKLKELPLFEFQVLATATDNFSLSNKLGQGGFGRVYKVWSIWNEGDVNGLVDPEIFDQIFEKEIRKCVHIALLCVQDAANDRPSVSTVCLMLSSEVADIPEPKQPAFMPRNAVLEAEFSESSDLKASINNVTITDVSGRYNLQNQNVCVIRETLKHCQRIIYHISYIDGYVSYI
ncbi:unnamed protein product [Arabidopsis arenosa]|uniref:Uncharacterized protein n=1 Tax=Arabidopsis arenosa TaxID=38785 RepID=A0A8S1ZGX8_ARAAE|nr:unnamed protein product [Arabidopsis arenosa]